MLIERKFYMTRVFNLELGKKYIGYSNQLLYMIKDINDSFVICDTKQAMLLVERGYRIAS